ncbi:hypothetical protein R6Q57_011413 [Mikania cordata]
MSWVMKIFLLAFLPLLLAFLLVKSYFSWPKHYKNVPPSPPKLPIIGNLHQLGSGVHRILHSMAKTYGPLIWLQLGSTPVVIVSSADAAREIMKTHDIIFSNRLFTSVIDKIFYGSKDVVFSSYGEYWRKLKSICVLHLLSSKQVQLYRQVREDETTQIIRKIQEANGSVVNLIARVALGKTYGYEHMVHRIANATARFSVGNYFPSFTWMDRFSGLHREADEIFKEYDDLLEGVIEEHVNKKDFGIKGHDLVDILLEIQKDKSTGFELERYIMKAIILVTFI